MGVIDDPRVTLQLVASFMIMINDCHIIIVQISVFTHPYFYFRFLRLQGQPNDTNENDILENDTNHQNDAHHNDTQRNTNQQNDTQQKDKRK